MPRFVRNFWVSGTADGVKSGIKGTGPNSADGGLELTILVREDGRISDRKLRIKGYARGDGALVLEAYEEGRWEERVTIATLR
jgi:hypothetical protein